MEKYRRFCVVREGAGYRVQFEGIDCGYYYTYNQALSAIDNYYCIKDAMDAGKKVSDDE